MGFDIFEKVCIAGICITLPLVYLLGNKIKEERKINFSVTKHETNGVDYLSIPINGKEVRLYQYQERYLPIERIRQLESEKAQRQVESNLVERVKGGNE